MNIEHNKKDLIKSRDRIEKESKNIEELKGRLEKNDSDLVFKKKELVKLKDEKDRIEH